MARTDTSADARATWHPAARPQIALYEPEIPGNVGAILRTAACLGAVVHIIEPCGFAFSERALRRAGLDYVQGDHYRHHQSWTAFRAATAEQRLVLMTTKAAESYRAFAFRGDDIILMGKESAGVPDEIHAIVDARITIPLMPNQRSLNVSVATALALAEAQRQLNL